ncbi:MFS transporter [Temperatibacter marinus]|uniref:MFS transporter n=1 Tax=Temperatibacter marinus TaxID=1456591 RepID=A0AA52H9W2_9PROT|nr:MFS transporter [Temperatibacter marinus]WND02962.1 MFS transporter [Temperatibacter marinus]
MTMEPKKSDNLSSGYPKASYAWYTVALLLVVYTFSFIDRQILGLLGNEVKQTFAISDTQFGLVTGYAFALFYAAFGLFFAKIADTKSRKWLIAFGLFVWSIMTALTAFSKSFLQLFLFRIGVGVGEATLAPAANSLIADSFPRERLSMALSVYSMGLPVGSGLAFILGGHVIDLAHTLPEISFMGFSVAEAWQKAFFMVGVPGILLAFLVAALREPLRKGAVQEKAKKTLNFSDLIQQYKKAPKAYNAIIIGTSLMLAISFGVIVFLAIFMGRIHEIDPGTVGKTFGGITLVGGVLGLFLGGWASDKLWKRGRKDAPILVILLALLFSFIPSLIFPLTDNISLMWFMLSAQVIFLNLPIGVCYAGLQIITPSHLRGQVAAVAVLAANLLGYGLGPVLIGLFTDGLFQDDMAIGKSMALLALVISPIAAFILAYGRKDFSDLAAKNM